MGFVITFIYIDSPALNGVHGNPQQHFTVRFYTVALVNKQ